MDYLHLQRGTGYSYYLCRLQQLDDDLFVERTGWRPFKASSPAESPKSVLTHEHFTCTLDAGGDAPQLTSKEIRPVARYTRQPAHAFENPKTPHPGGTLSGRTTAMGYPRSTLSPLDLSRIVALQE